MSTDQTDPDHHVDRAVKLIGEEGFAGFIRNVGIGGVFYAIVYQLISIITGAGLVIMAPLRAFADGLSYLVEVGIGGPAGLIDVSFLVAEDSFLYGAASYLGITAPLFGIIIAMSSVFLFMWFVRRIGLSPWAFIARLRR